MPKPVTKREIHLAFEFSIENIFRQVSQISETSTKAEWTMLSKALTLSSDFAAAMAEKSKTK